VVCAAGGVPRRLHNATLTFWSRSRRLPLIADRRDYMLSNLRKGPLQWNVTEPSSRCLLPCLQRFAFESRNSRLLACPITAQSPLAMLCGHRAWGQTRRAGGVALPAAGLPLWLPLSGVETAALGAFMLPSSGFLIGFPWRLCQPAYRGKMVRAIADPRGSRRSSIGGLSCFTSSHQLACRSRALDKSLLEIRCPCSPCSILRRPGSKAVVARLYHKRPGQGAP